MLTPSEFAEQYRAGKPKASNKEIARAYNEYVENNSVDDSEFAASPALDIDTEESTSHSVKDDSYGVERNEYSEKLDQKVVSAIDALAKLFYLKVRFGDLGGDNGLYHADTGLIELDISPYHNGASNGFLFSVSHEIGHAVKARIGANAWTEFSGYAVKAKGGEKAIKAKQESAEVYAEYAVAREEVVCDFIGELLSEQKALDTFCESIKGGAIKAETARGIVAAWRKITGILRGKGMKQTDTATAALVQRVQEQFGTDIETAENAVRKMQKALAAAMKAETQNKNAAENNSHQENMDTRYYKNDKPAVSAKDKPAVSAKDKPAVSAKDKHSSSIQTQEDATYLLLAEKYRDGTATVEETEQLQKMVDEAAKAAGYITAARYHPTSVRFNAFKTDNPIAAKYDSETPDGIFFKMNDHDIGIGGDVQMKVYLETENTLSFKNRAEANQWYCENVDGYEELQEEMKRAIKPIDDKIEEMEYELFAGDTTGTRFLETVAEKNRLLKEMEVLETRYRGKLRELLNDFFLDEKSGYDSIELEYDGHIGVNGKRENVRTVIVFNAEQAKSADPVTYDDNGNVIPLSERFNSENAAIRGPKKDKPAVSAYTEHYGTVITSQTQAQEDRPKARSEAPLTEQFNIDNAENNAYNKNRNGGEQYDSSRMDQGMAEGVPVRRIYDNRDAQARGNGRGNQGILRRNLSKNLSKAFNESGVVAAELYSFDGDRAAFSSALDAAREADAKNGWCVTPQSAEKLSGKLTFMDDGSTIGFVLTDSGDIEGVFKNPEKNKTRRAMSGVMPQAIAAGGTKLDCYGTRLVRLYENYGFIPVARVAFNEKYANPGWDASKGKPDVFIMMHNGDSAETVVSKIGAYPHMSEEQLANLPLYDKNSYNSAKEYRDKLLEERKKQSETKHPKKDKPKRIVPTPEEAKALDERLKAREEEKAAKKRKERDETIKRLVYTSPGFAPYRLAKDNLSSMADHYGRIPQGESPARDVTVPVSTDGETKVRRTVRTAMEAEATPKEMIPHIEESIVEGNFNYKQKKNAKTMEAAREWVERRGDVTKAYEDWISEKNRRLNADMIARGFIIYNNLSNAYVNAKTETERTALREKAISILQDISVMGTVAGQTAQAIRLLKQQSPESQYYALERSVRKLQDGINERYGDKQNDAPKIEIDKERAAKWIQALREGDMELAYDLEEVLFQQIAKQIPKTLSDRLNAWRYLSMLGNPKTLIRNAFGNAAFTPIAMAKDQIGALMEKLLPKEQRTKYFGSLHASKEGRALLKFASEDALSSDVQQMMERILREVDLFLHRWRVCVVCSATESCVNSPLSLPHNAIFANTE